MQIAAFSFGRRPLLYLITFDSLTRQQEYKEGNDHTNDRQRPPDLLDFRRVHGGIGRGFNGGMTEWTFGHVIQHVFSTLGTGNKMPLEQ
jgi:hypothetical protein